jgi:Uma2 family endonuclease
MGALFLQGARLTAEEAWRLNPSEHWELVDGWVVSMSPPGARHGSVVATVTRLLGEFVVARGLGTVFAGDSGFILRRNPDTVRGPDVAFIGKARLPGRPPVEFMSGAPDLAIEVVSPSDDWKAVDRKAQEYLSAGAIAVWAIDPGTETAKVYSSAGSRSLARGDALACPELLGDFAPPLPALWA